MERHQPLEETHQFAPAPTAELQRKIGLVSKKDTPGSHFLLKKRVDVTTPTHTACELCQLGCAALESQQQTDWIELKLLKSR